MSVSATVIPMQVFPTLCNGCGLRARYAVGESSWCGECAVKSIKALAAIVSMSEPALKKDINLFFRTGNKR